MREILGTERCKSAQILQIWKMLQHDFSVLFICKIGFDTAEKEPSNVPYKSFTRYNDNDWIPSLQTRIGSAADSGVSIRKTGKQMHWALESRPVKPSKKHKKTRLLRRDGEGGQATAKPELQQSRTRKRSLGKERDWYGRGERSRGGSMRIATRGDQKKRDKKSRPCAWR